MVPHFNSKKSKQGIPWLPGISEDVFDLVRNLTEIQDKFAHIGRFHLTLETEISSGINNSSEPNTVTQSEVRMLFSPAISFTTKQASGRAYELVTTLSALAIIAKINHPIGEYIFSTTPSVQREWGTNTV